LRCGVLARTPLQRDVLELPVAVGMLEALAGLGVGLQAEAKFLEQPADQIKIERARD